MNIIEAHDVPFLPGYSGYVPLILQQSHTVSHTGDAETIDITGSNITVPKGHFAPGVSFRWTMSGSRAGTAGAATLLIVLGATTAISIAIPSNTALDWYAQFTVSCYQDMAHQRCFGLVAVNGATTYVAVDDAAATVDVSQEITIKAQATLANASDDIYVNHVMVETWQVPE